MSRDLLPLVHRPGLAMARSPGQCQVDRQTAPRQERTYSPAKNECSELALDVVSMEQRIQTQEALKHQIAMALEQGMFSPELIRTIGTHCRKRRKEGRTPAYIAEELGISEWQVADWIAREGQEERRPSQDDKGRQEPGNFILSVPLTFRFERLLSREIVRSMQTCDSCCWKRFVASLPSEFKVEKADEQS